MKAVLGWFQNLPVLGLCTAGGTGLGRVGASLDPLKNQILATIHTVTQTLALFCFVIIVFFCGSGR
jgi:hypothetical protein